MSLIKFQHDNDYQKQLRDAAAFIRENDRFAVISHVNPDGDAAASTFAVGWILKALNKSFVLLNDGPIPPKFTYMGGEVLCIYQADQLPIEFAYNHVICVDCADFGRVGRERSWFPENASFLNVDHHATNDYFADINLVLGHAAATVEVLYDLAVELNIPYCDEFGISLYSGLLTDTGGFRYSCTSAKVMRIAASLIESGVQGHLLSERLLEQTTKAQLFILRRALDTLQFAHDGKVAWLTVSTNDQHVTGATNEDLDMLVNYPRNVEGVSVGLLFKEREPGVFKISMRSNGDLDVSYVASRFNGGGHKRAAGCTVSGKLEEVVKKVIDAIGSEWE